MVSILLLVQKSNEEIIIRRNPNKIYSKELLLLINQERRYDKLLEISYSCSGDMNGNVDKITLDVDNKTITHEYKAIHSDPLKVRKNKVSEKNIKQLKKQIYKYNFPLWKDLEDSEFVALDAPSCTLTFTYDNSSLGGPKTEWYSVDLDKEIPKDGRGAINHFIDSLLKLSK